MALEQQVRLVLIAGELQGVNELRLILPGLQVPADAPDARPQQEPADHQAEHGHPDDEPGEPHRVRGRGHAICLRVAPLDEKQAVQVSAQRLIGGGQPGGERRVRPGRHGGRAEEITDGDPLPDEPLESGVLRGRIVGVQPHEGGEPGIGRREQAGVERAETA
jgi:hypothetical protein